MKTEAGRVVDSTGTASATTRITIFIFFFVSSGCSQATGARGPREGVKANGADAAHRRLWRCARLAAHQHCTAGPGPRAPRATPAHLPLHAVCRPQLDGCQEGQAS